jgi:alpha-N-arabinofuranosidase
MKKLMVLFVAGIFVYACSSNNNQQNSNSARGPDLRLLVAAGDGAPALVAVADARTLDSVATGGFLGLWAGVLATSAGRPTTTVAHVRSVVYSPVH